MVINFSAFYMFLQVLKLLSPILVDWKVPIDVIAFTAISLGLIYVGSCNDEVAQSIIIALMERSDSELGEPLIRFLCLGLGLLYLGKQVSGLILNRVH
jgi:26S proteasome regulatory subunit N1